MVLPNAERLVAEAQEVDPLESRVQILEAKVKALETMIKDLAISAAVESLPKTNPSNAYKASKLPRTEV